MNSVTLPIKREFLSLIGCERRPPLPIGWNIRRTCPTPCYWPRTANMAAFGVARNSCGLLNGLRISFRNLAQVKPGAVAGTAPRSNQQRDCRWYSASHLSVKERIDNKRKAALVGGGQMRIDAQHKRVNKSHIILYFYSIAFKSAKCIFNFFLL